MQNLERESWYVGNLVGVPIFAHWSALIMVLMVAAGSYQQPVVLVVTLIVLIFAILLHELGHGLTAQAFGSRGITITLWAFGGLCRSTRDPARIGRELAIVAAGPAVSLALAVIGWIAAKQLYNVDLLSPMSGYALYKTGSLLALFVVKLYHVNLWLFIFNMMPIYPMDGGQLVYNAALGVTRRQLLARQITLTLAVPGAIGLFCWQTELITVLQLGGGIGDWANQLGFNDLFLAVLLAFIVRSAFLILA